MPPHAADVTPGPADSGVLHKVRSLLAKAESTTFPDEAEALTAKAQQLMDRHAIDRAVLAAATPGDRAHPVGRRITIEAPYARAKFQLLTELARANRCRAVWARHLGEATVVGFSEDQETIELLYTSLLVQATSAMLRSGRSASTRTRSYRQSFLIAFAARIGQRLQSAAEASTAQADAAHGGAVLPVLHDRALAVEDMLAREFPQVRTMRVTARDHIGYAAGHAAADRAHLGRDGELRG